jgi:PST family polysaccharide transporter
VLGRETFGLVIFAQAIVGYLVILVSFGFNISATKEVSIYRDNKEKLSEIVSSVLIIKVLLFFVSIIILIPLVIFIPEAKTYLSLFVLTMWMCIYDVIFPIWYFQGIEKMKYITYITLLSRLFFLFLIFLMIHSPKDYLKVPIINSIGALIAGIISLFIVFKKQQLKFSLQPYSRLRYYFIESAPIFIANFSTTIYSSTNKVILGIFLSMKDVAYYDLAEKLSSLLKTPIQIIGQTIYPQVAKNKNKVFLKHAFFITLMIALLILSIGIILSNFFVRVLGGNEMLPSIDIFNILIISIIPVSISLFFTNLLMISWGYNKDYLMVRIFANIFYMVSMLALYIFGIIDLYSLSILTVVIEIFIVLLSFFIINKRGINFLKKGDSI